MTRVTARPPEGVTELCLVRLDFQARGLPALWYAAKLGRAIDRSAAEAIKAGAGLLRSERFAFRVGHYGVIQYWRGFDAMEAWTRTPPHSEWWRGAVERMRKRGDFGVSHETYLVPRDKVEAIALGCSEPAGLFAFGVTGGATGDDTNARGRLAMGKKVND